MTRDEILILIKQRLGFRMNYDDAVIFAHLDLIQVQYEKVSRTKPLPWFLLNTTHTVDTVASTRSVARPTNFIAFEDDWPLTIVNADNERKRLRRAVPYDLSHDDYEEEGFPTHFIFNNTNLDLYPLPNAVYTITIPHYARTDKWSENTTNDWYTEFPELVIEETLSSIMRTNRDEMGLKLLDLNGAREAYFTRVNEMQQVHKSSVMNSNG